MPEHDLVDIDTKQALDRYWSHGTHPGGFLERVLCNDLFGAVNHADLKRQIALADIVKYIFNGQFPIACYGSRENFDAWRAHGGAKGNA